jgi:hypothetical protein
MVLNGIIMKYVVWRMCPKYNKLKKFVDELLSNNIIVIHKRPWRRSLIVVNLVTSYDGFASV